MIAQYIFTTKKASRDKIIGSLYKFEGGKKVLVEKNFVLNQDTPKEVKVGILCQLVSEGLSLTSALQQGSVWTPTEYEFYLWLEGDKPLKMAYLQAKRLRSQGLIERLYKNIEKSGDVLSEETLQSSIKILQQVATLLQKEVDDDSDRVVVQAYIYPLPDYENN